MKILVNVKHLVQYQNSMISYYYFIKIIDGAIMIEGFNLYVIKNIYSKE